MYGLLIVSFIFFSPISVHFWGERYNTVTLTIPLLTIRNDITYIFDLTKYLLWMDVSAKTKLRGVLFFCLIHEV